MKIDIFSLYRKESIMLYQVMSLVTEKIWFFNAILILSFTLVLIFKLKKDLFDLQNSHEDTHS